MKTPEGLLYLDRTRNSTDLKCRRRRYWAFEFRRRGLSPKARPLPLEFGSIMHDSLAELLIGRDLEEVVEHAVVRYRDGLTNGLIAWDKPERVKEQEVFIEGLLRGWARYVLPQIRETYEVEVVEGEVLYDFLGCRLGAKPDVLLRRRSDGSLWYIEWKTTASMSPDWFRSWTKAVQLHAGALGVSRTIGKELAGAIVFAINKGFQNKKMDRQESIFCYGYRRKSDGPELLTYEYKPGTVKSPVWEWGSTKQWVSEMPEEILAEQFGDTGPIFLDERLCEAWLKQTAFREKEIDHAVDLVELAQSREATEEILDRYFQQNFDECLPAFGGYKCSYHDACHVQFVGDNPLGSGSFEMRQPHHSTDPVFMVEELARAAAAVLE